MSDELERPSVAAYLGEGPELRPARGVLGTCLPEDLELPDGRPKRALRGVAETIFARTPWVGPLLTAP